MGTKEEMRSGGPTGGGLVIELESPIVYMAEGIGDLSTVLGGRIMLEREFLGSDC